MDLSSMYLPFPSQRHHMSVMEPSMFAEELSLTNKINSQNCLIIVLRLIPDNLRIPLKIPVTRTVFPCYYRKYMCIHIISI